MATLAQLRTRARARADMELASGQSEADHFITDSILTDFINDAVSELYDLITDSNLDIYTTSGTISTTAGTLEYACADMYMLRHLEVSLGGDKYADIPKFNFKERNRRGLSYRFINGKIQFNDDPGTKTYRRWYIPTLTALSADGDTFSPFNRWEEYVVTRAAIKMKQKEESDTTDLKYDLAALADRIVGKADQQDSGEPDSISDVRSAVIDDDGWEWDDY